MANKKTIGEIKKICKDFITALGDDATGELVFPILADIAAQYSLRLEARQRGINGTYLRFVKEQQ